MTPRETRRDSAVASHGGARGLPPQHGLMLDPSTRRAKDGRLVYGGKQGRVLRLTSRGARKLEGVLRRDVRDAETAQLAERLIEAGLAHPVPPRRDALDEVTVVIPVYARAASLDRCLARLPPVQVVVVDDGSPVPEAITSVCDRHGVRLLRASRNGGPAAARNLGLQVVETSVVVFLDSDCEALPHSLEHLLGHLDDPQVVAVAPRVVPALDACPRGALARFLQVASPLDLGPAPGAVTRDGAVSYVPTAALMARTDVVSGFDERLRYGEDVDLVWRLVDAGHEVRYDPRVRVRHHEPSTWREVLTRRLHYGSSAGGLARRHPGRVAPAVVRPLTAASVSGLMVGQPWLTAAAFAYSAVRAVRGLHPIGISPADAVRWSASTMLESTSATTRAATSLFWPVMVLTSVRSPRLRPWLLVLAVLAPVRDFVHRKPSLDLGRWTFASLANDVAYGVGVWAGAIRSRTAGPLIPRLRGWSPGKRDGSRVRWIRHPGGRG